MNLRPHCKTGRLGDATLPARPSWKSASHAHASTTKLVLTESVASADSVRDLFELSVSVPVSVKRLPIEKDLGVKQTLCLGLKHLWVGRPFRAPHLMSLHPGLKRLGYFVRPLRGHWALPATPLQRPARFSFPDFCPGYAATRLCFLFTFPNDCVPLRAKIGG
jgi:hypothetical protein